MSRIMRCFNNTFDFYEGVGEVYCVKKNMPGV